MKINIENSNIKICVDSMGAELKSIIGKKENTQFLYDGNGEFWNYSSPVLFPFVGRLNDACFLFNGKSYKMPIHGFARLSEFEIIKHKESYVSFLLKSTKSTHEQYPFDFLFSIDYEILNNIIRISYRVENTGKSEMYFGLGAHPGFLCPINSCQNETFEDYYLQFDEKETAGVMTVTPKGLFSGETQDYLTNENRIDLKYNLFKNDALVFYDLKSSGICLKSKKHNKHVRMDYNGFKYLGIWTVPGAPFLCIEPWLSYGDYENFNEELSQKPGIIKIRPQEVHSYGLSVSVFE